MWRTSCPRLSIWEDACIEGLVEFGAGGAVMLTERGARLVLMAQDPGQARAASGWAGLRLAVQRQHDLRRSHDNKRRLDAEQMQVRTGAVAKWVSQLRDWSAPKY